MSSVDGHELRARDAENQSMDRLTVRFPDAQLEAIEAVVEAGEYANNTEVVREAVRELLGTGGAE